jgi:hypothetical protein
MTVTNTSYSTIEEAWADTYLSPSIQKKSKKKRSSDSPMSDPICDLYEMGNNNNYDDSDIVSYANKFYEKHEKAKYQKPRMHEREKLPKVVDIDVSDDIAYGAPFNRVLREEAPQKQVTFSDEDEEDEIERYIQPSKKREKLMYDTNEYYGEDDDNFNKRDQSFNYFDIFLYIISGIILIFMMDQFVKIGTLMK